MFSAIQCGHEGERDFQIRTYRIEIPYCNSKIESLAKENASLKDTVKQLERDMTKKFDTLITGTINGTIKTAAVLPKIAGASSSQINSGEGTMHTGTATKHVTLLGYAQTTNLQGDIKRH